MRKNTRKHVNLGQMKSAFVNIFGAFYRLIVNLMLCKLQYYYRFHVYSTVILPLDSRQTDLYVLCAFV